ncbi:MULTISPECIES: multidrug efflux SMR transporter [Sphaerospermopsis]|jgi:small multidrug resistance pump|uniref:Multidrug efflux SMR transporter n=1 Tax=Sphaerospermopsis torques-reginae ITEP-024 TaxID=984208 RepID=A0ABX8X166_9CYAN|nr:MULTISPECIES: multidrug efflux SMR transporter [Sphaerospermopsis]MBE9059052.1 multidrug efflux SMR transporter [Sphaerospermopsis sp. LEGE 08334]QYX32436.1 multidrug efflux SMR transporter [Sphaerospermopsis torques-reginae ITEP-024]
MLISWFYLIIAILFEVSGTICMKLSQEFTKLFPSVFIFVFYGLCLTFLTLSLRKLEVSIVYAVWAGLGTVLISIIGIVWFRESFTLMKFVSIVLIIVGVISLNLSEYGR